MDKNYEQIPPVLMSKLYNSTMNSNQKNKYHKQADTTAKTDTAQEDKASFVTKASTWNNTDRRSTNDRRKKMAKRGRWLDSRNSTDRRKAKEAVSITI